MTVGPIKLMSPGRDPKVLGHITLDDEVAQYIADYTLKSNTMFELNPIIQIMPGGKGKLIGLTLMLPAAIERNANATPGRVEIDP